MTALAGFFWNHWYFAYPMLLMSLAAVALVIWRIMLNINGATQMDAFLPAFQDRLEKEGVQGALRFCRGRTDVIPRRLYVAGLEAYKGGLAAVRRAMGNVIELEIVPDLNFLLPVILAIAKIATMVGLFGTVLSMIGVFDAIQHGGGAITGDQIGEIGLALFATALGLITAIPLVFAHVLFKAYVSRFELRLKAAAQRLLLLLQNVKPVEGKAASSAQALTAPMKPDPASIARR